VTEGAVLAQLVGSWTETSRSRRSPAGIASAYCSEDAALAWAVAATLNSGGVVAVASASRASAAWASAAPASAPGVTPLAIPLASNTQAPATMLAAAMRPIETRTSTSVPERRALRQGRARGPAS